MRKFEFNCKRYHIEVNKFILKQFLEYIFLSHMLYIYLYTVIYIYIIYVLTQLTAKCNSQIIKP